MSREAVSQLREGMTRDQVRFLLGTPLLTDVFHADRWDYYFSFRRGSRPVVQSRQFTVYFEGDKLVRWVGNELPSEYELIAEIDGMKAAQKNQTPGKLIFGGEAAPASAPAAMPASASAPAAMPVAAASEPAAAPAAVAPAAAEAAQQKPAEAPANAASDVPAKPAS